MYRGRAPENADLFDTPPPEMIPYAYQILRKPLRGRGEGVFMHQETVQGGKESAKVDFIIVVAFVFVILFIRQIIDLVAALPAPFNAIGQLALLAGVVVVLALVYDRRISGYRYTIVYRQIEEGEENEFGHAKPYPWPVGAILFERIVGKKGKILEKIDPEEFVALLAPGETYPERVGFLNSSRLTVKRSKTAHTALFRRKGRLYAIVFHPTEEMVGYIRQTHPGEA